ncbi:hypothetical protein AB8O64_32420 [Streptomyces sp. QH1-20]|uniref:hypothetical protein n=1 Tax=Streptomyces sp. QH1-20 TaxID=3240934 RepID=UPI003515F98F
MADGDVGAEGSELQSHGPQPLVPLGGRQRDRQREDSGGVEILLEAGALQMLGSTGMLRGRSQLAVGLPGKGNPRRTARRGGLLFGSPAADVDEGFLVAGQRSSAMGNWSR